MSTRFSRESAGNRHNELHRLILTRQLNDNDNKVCADCTERMPRWSSWSLGCFVCLKCSGVHRSLGVHVSKMKSVNLDTWTREQINHVISRGNKWTNGYYLSEHQEGPSYRISNDANAMQLTQFIRNKYEGKKFMRHGKAPPLVDRSDLVASCEKQIYGKSRTREKVKQTASPVKVQVPIASTNRPKGDQSKINPPQLQNGENPVESSQKSNVQNLMDLDFGNFGGFSSSPAQNTAQPVNTTQNNANDIFGVAAPSNGQDANWADFSQLSFNQNSQPNAPAVDLFAAQTQAPSVDLFAPPTQAPSITPQTTIMPQTSQPVNPTQTPTASNAPATVPTPAPASNSIASIMSLYSKSPAPTQVSQTSTSNSVDIFAQLSNPSQKPNNLPINLANPFMAAPSPDVNPMSSLQQSTGQNLFAQQQNPNVAQFTQNNQFSQNSQISQNTQIPSQPAQHNVNPFADFSSFGAPASSVTPAANPFDAFSELQPSQKSVPNSNVSNALDNLQLF